MEPYSNREIDRMFGEIQDSLDAQDKVLAETLGRVKETNGNVAKAFLQIADNKSDTASNWRAILVGTSIFIGIVIPLVAIIYYKSVGDIKTLQNQVTKLQQK